MDNKDKYFEKHWDKTVPFHVSPMSKRDDVNSPAHYTNGSQEAIVTIEEAIEMTSSDHYGETVSHNEGHEKDSNHGEHLLLKEKLFEARFAARELRLVRIQKSAYPAMLLANKSETGPCSPFSFIHPLIP